MEPLKRFLVCCLLLINLVFAHTVCAQNDFYTGSVSVNDRSPAAYKQGINDALLQVLVKVSAEIPEKIKQNPNLLIELAQGERFTSQFSYFPKTILLHDGTTKNQLYIKVSFSERIITGLLKKGNLRIWAQPRVPVMVIPTLKMGGQVFVAGVTKEMEQEVSKPSSDFVVSAMNEMSGRYGINALFTKVPVDSEKVWQLNIPVISQVAATANSKVVLVSQMNVSVDGRASGKWLLLDESQVSTIDLTTDSVASFVEKGMFWASNALANHYAEIVTSEVIGLSIAVDGIDDFQKYQNLFSYLESLKILQNIRLIEVSGSILKVSLKIKTSLDQFQAILKADKKLLPDDVIVSDPSQINLYWNE